MTAGTAGGDFAALMRRLCAEDVQVFADGDALRYDAPAGAISEDLLVELKRGKQALLDWIAGDESRADVVSRALPSYSQQEMWGRARSSPCPAVLGISQRIAFDGSFDPDAMQTALSRLVARHEPLRMRFRSFPDGDGDQPVSEVLAPRPVRLDVVDLGDTPQPRRQALLDEHCRRSVAEPLALDDAPLWRARLYRLAADSHVLLWTVHHAICDGSSLAILLDELLMTYDAARSGALPHADPPSPTIADFARRQRRDLNGERMDALAAYWRSTLRGASLRLDFPYDASPPATPTGRGGMCEFAAPPEVLERLRAAARRLGSTLYLLTLSAYALTLSRFTGQDEVVLPTSHANRAEPGYESTVGMIADRIPIRVRTGEASTFADLVGQVGQTVFSALDHQAMPMRLLTASLPPHQRLTPYPGALFTLLERRGRPTLPGLRVDVASEVPVGLARMELYCFTSAGEDGLRGAIEYAADRFDAATIERFVAGFVARLEAVAADPSVGLDAT